MKNRSHRGLIFKTAILLLFAIVAFIELGHHKDTSGLKRSTYPEAIQVKTTNSSRINSPIGLQNSGTQAPRTHANLSQFD